MMSTYTAENVQWALRMVHIKQDSDFAGTQRMLAREAGLPPETTPHDIIATTLAEQRAEIARLEQTVKSSQSDKDVVTMEIEHRQQKPIPGTPIKIPQTHAERIAKFMEDNH